MEKKSFNNFGKNKENNIFTPTIKKNKTVFFLLSDDSKLINYNSKTKYSSPKISSKIIKYLKTKTSSYININNNFKIIKN